MMNLPLKLRTQKSLCSPNGPNFARAWNMQFSLDSTTIQLRAPRHRPKNASNEVLHPPRRFHSSRERFRPVVYGNPSIVDSSDLQGNAIGSVGAISGQQLIELESLADVDPAIFTAVRMKGK